MSTSALGAARRPRLFARVLLLAGLAVGIASTAFRPAEGGETATKRFRDKNAKFSFMLFPDWDQVPLETEGKFGSGGSDKYAVCQFFQRGADKKDLLPGKLVAFRMGGGASGLKTGTTTGEDAPKEEDAFLKKLRSLMGDDEPKTMRDLFMRVLADYRFLDETPKPGAPQPDWDARKKDRAALAEKVLDPKLAKPIKSRDAEPVPGLMWVFERKNPQIRSEKPCFLVMAAWKKDDMEVGLWLHCTSEQKKAFEQGFQVVVRSFKWFDDKAKDVASLDVLNGLPISPAKRREIEKALVDTWDVLVSPKKNYIILYNTNGKRNDLLARIIGERIEMIREQVYEHQFPPAAKIEAVCIVRICKDRSEYFTYGGPGGSAGYWSSNTEELVFYDASPKKEPDDDTLAVLYHEAFHQYIYYSVGEVAPHSWFNEGHGDYYAGSKYLTKKFSIRPFNWRVGIIKGALVKGACKPEAEDPKKVATPDSGDDEGGPAKRVAWDRSSGGYTPLEYFVRMTQGEYYSYPDVCYAQGWSLIYFLREIVPKNPKWNEKWGKILDTYFSVLKAEANRDKPLTPKKAPKPEDPGMDGGAPGKGPTTPTPPAAPPVPVPTPGPGAPGATPPTGGDDEPGMGEPDPGMSGGEPGMGGDEPGGDVEPPEGFIPPPSMFRGSSGALKKAVEEAFKGVDFAELETAWRDTMKKIGSGK